MRYSRHCTSRTCAGVAALYSMPLSLLRHRRRNIKWEIGYLDKSLSRPGPASPGTSFHKPSTDPGHPPPELPRPRHPQTPSRQTRRPRRTSCRSTAPRRRAAAPGPPAWTVSAGPGTAAWRIHISSETNSQSMSAAMRTDGLSLFLPLVRHPSPPSSLTLPFSTLAR